MIKISSVLNALSANLRQPGEGPSRSLHRNSELFADVSFAAAALYIIVIVVDNVEGVVECGAVHGTGATGGDTEDGLGWWRPGLATSASGSLAQPSSRAASAAQ